jgi:HAD superfamily hydrolase (TIGR01490 family)
VTELRRAAFFDMDRTLIRVNSAALFVRWQVRRGAARRRDLAHMLWWLTQYTFGKLDVETLAAQAALTMRGRDEAAFRTVMRDWIESEVLPHIAARARAEVARRRREGYECVVLTSSTPYAAEPLAEQLAIEHVLASRLTVEDGQFTGAYVAPLCYGPGKVVLAEAWARTHGVALTDSAFYTDSISDLPMLERVGEPVAVNPDPRLWWAARRRGWRIEHW